jgi:hypothetical protein
MDNTPALEIVDLRGKPENGSRRIFQRNGNTSVDTGQEQAAADNEKLVAQV